MLVILFVAIIGAGAAWHQWSQRMDRWQSESEPALLERCTNDLVGFHRITDKVILDFDRNPAKWTATVTAEYVNHLGGIDQTNLPYKFSLRDGHITCAYDWEEVFNEQQDALQRELKRIQNGP
jgi:hypothetical protein